MASSGVDGWNAVLILVAASGGKGTPTTTRFHGWDLLWHTVSAVDELSELVVSISRSSTGTLGHGKDRQVKIVFYRVVASHAIKYTGWNFIEHTCAPQQRCVRKSHAAVVLTPSPPALGSAAVHALGRGVTSSASDFHESRCAFQDVAAVFGPLWPALLHAAKSVAAQWLDQISHAISFQHLSSVQACNNKPMATSVMNVLDGETARLQHHLDACGARTF